MEKMFSGSVIKRERLVGLDPEVVLVQVITSLFNQTPPLPVSHIRLTQPHPMQL